VLIELAPLLSALLMWLAFPPVGWGILAAVAPTPLLVAIRRARSYRGAAAIGFLYGVAFFGGLLWWIKFAGFLALFALILGLAFYAAAFALLLHFARQFGTAVWWMTAVGAWAFIEYARAHWPFGGLPWGLAGYGAGAWSPARSATQFIGTTGWSVVFIAIAAGLALFLSDRRHPRLFLLLPVALAAVLVAAGALWPRTAEGAPVDIAVIQGNSPCPGSHCPNENLLIFQSHLELTSRLRNPGPDLIVWPESSAGSNVELVTHPDRAELVAEEARRLGSYFLIGSHRNVSATEFVNVNVMMDPAGEIIGEYQKQHPVPFGEYVPLRPLLDWIPALDQTPRDMVSGNEFTVFELPGGRLGSVVSFEGAFARSVRPLVREEAELMVVATNEATFQDSPASDQFIAMTRMRAAESGLDLVHAAITGKSALILADGTVIDVTELLRPEVMRGTLNYSTAGPTLYARLGDWLQLGTMAAAAVVLGLQIARARLRAESKAD
jgi:apolipoprotein N-acyltransferase